MTNLSVEETKLSTIKWNGWEIHVEPDEWRLYDPSGTEMFTGNAESLRDFDNMIGKAREIMARYLPEKQPGIRDGGLL